MSRIYSKPPLIEALCEFQFTESDWDLTIPGLVYDQIRKDFPGKRQVSTELGVELQTAEGQLNQRILGRVERIQFYREDESALVQVAPHLLVINHLLPYPHWGVFRDLILGTLSVYRSVAHPSALKRIGLRYINRIALSVQDSGHLERYFNFSPRVPAALSGPLDAILMRIEQSHFADNGRLLVTLGTVNESGPAQIAYLLDLDFITQIDTPADLDMAENWIETAHAHIEQAFETCITDELRSSFEVIQ